MIPISDVLPLSKWIRIHHNFRARLNAKLASTGKNLYELHEDKFGAPSQNSWVVGKLKVTLQGKAINFEIPDGTSTDEALDWFYAYTALLGGSGDISV